MAVIVRKATQAGSSAPGLFVVVGIIVCLCFAAPILWYLRKRRDSRTAKWKAKVARVANLENSVRVTEHSLQGARRQLNDERARARDLQQGNGLLLHQKNVADALLSEAQQQAAHLEGEVERVKREARQQENAVVNLQGEVISLEEAIRAKEERLGDLQRKFDFVNQQFLASQANTPQTSPLSSVW
ncbi:MAG: hypothetical protein M1839_008168 [Geoglossum umbratile]|nr:MAG: hypothetical protein M1839_008168 [Geoglossum umbratile]